MTNSLRKLIKTKLGTLDSALGVKEVAYQTASGDEMYPHIVYAFDSISAVMDDLHRRDYTLLVDIWDRNKSASTIEDITDAVIKLFEGLNVPQTDILPTFYLERSGNFPNDDKNIKHNQIKYTVQVYERM